MIITLVNTTASPKSYVSGTVNISASSTVSVAQSNFILLSEDPQLFSDITTFLVNITDGINTFIGDDAIRYLQKVADRYKPMNDGNGTSMTVGQKTMAASMPVVLASDSSTITTTFRNSFSRVTGNTTSTVKSGAGVLHGIIIGNNGTGGTITIYDNTAGSGTVIMQLDVGTPSGGLLSSSGQPTPIFLGPLGTVFATGLTVVTSGSSSNDITVVYQ